MTSLAVSPALQALRERTSSLHAELERTLQLMHPDAGRAHYAQHVAAMWGWLQPLEPTLWSGTWPAELDVAERSIKVRWLEEDLAAARNDGLLREDSACCATVADFSSRATRYGWAYVIEGSMLGGQVLRARLAERLHPWPARYLCGYGDAGGQRWRAFLAALAKEVRTPADIAEAADAAAAAFTSVGFWLRARGAA